MLRIYSQRGMDLTRSFEGCRYKAYQDGGGVWTIGYGHTLFVVEGQTCDMAQAVQWLMFDIQYAVHAVNKLVDVDLTQGQFDAIVDLVFNIGVNAFRTSTMLRLLLIRDYLAAAEQFPRWNKDNGKVVSGLTRRRAYDRAMFLGDTHAQT